MTGFYTTLPSDVSGALSSTDFLTRLPEPYEFGARWEVGLQEVLFSGPILTVSVPQSFSITREDGSVIEYVLPKGTYSTPQSLVDALNYTVATAGGGPATKRARRDAPQQQPLEVDEEELVGVDVKPPLTKEEQAAAAKKAETDRIAKEEAAKKAKEEVERKAKEEANRKAKEEADKKAAKEEADRKAKEEADRKAKEQADKKAAKEEADRKAKEEADRKAKEEADKNAAKEEADRKAKEEADRKAKEEADKKAAKEEADRKAKEAAEKKAREDEERRRREEEEAAAAPVTEEELDGIQVQATLEQQEKERKEAEKAEIERKETEAILAAIKEGTQVPIKRVHPDELPGEFIPATGTQKHDVVFVYNSTLGKMMINFKENVASLELSTQLQYMLGFEKHVLTDSSLATRSPDCLNSKSFVFVYSDIVQFSVTGNQKTNLLRVIPFPKIKDEPISQDYRQVRYIGVKSSFVDSIRIQLLDAQGNDIVVNGHVCIVLHFRKVE